MLSFSARYLSRLAWSISMPLLILEVPVVTPRSTCSRVWSSPRAEVTSFTLMVEIPILEAGLRLEAMSSRNTASSASTPRVFNPLFRSDYFYKFIANLECVLVNSLFRFPHPHHAALHDLVKQLYLPEDQPSRPL